MKFPPLKSARMISYLMIVLIIFAITGIGYLSYEAQNILVAKSVETDHARIEAKVAEEQITRLKSLQATMERTKDTVDKTAQIVAESQSYNFQDQVIKDLTSYADKAGVSIILIDFGDKPGEKPPASANSKNNLKRTEVTIQLDNNMPYKNLLTFIRSIEQNVTKMQLSGINFQPKKEDPNLVLGSTIKIEVYLR